jgi:deoxyribodipyrimidine photolyase-related protein
MEDAFIVFPHQLFEDISLLQQSSKVYLIEEYLFFNQYKFHKQKLVLHRASMKFYEHFLQQHQITTLYIDAISKKNKIQQVIESIASTNIKTIHFYDVCDDWLQKSIEKGCKKFNIKIHQHPTKNFINTIDELENYFGKKQKFFQTDFYIQQRKKLQILVENNKPIGDKWSFDSDNRLKYPKDKKVPIIEFPSLNKFYTAAIQYVEKHFSTHYGNISTAIIYPTTFQESKLWLHNFLQHRFAEFGAYEDAIVAKEKILHHSVLTPMLNIGLLTPQQIIEEALKFAEKNQIPLNSLEGFIRQIIGWREFIRGVYVFKGSEERTRNFWKFNRKIPASFYTATTGIAPIDETIKKIIDTGYCHHIERLMLLGNFMLLCEIDPNEVYKWFMELFIDSYDWVMVPNVYGMSQFADAGIMATKPYISGSSYVLKMSDYKKGNWCSIWDALFWCFMHEQRNFFLSNPRLGMLLKTYDKMSEEKKNNMKMIKKEFITSLYNT